MNTSPYVTSEICQRCGKCCQHFRLFYRNGLPRPQYDEMIRVLYCQGIDASIQQVEGGHWLILNHPCKYLRHEGGLYSCELYDDPCRPSICAAFPYKDQPLPPECVAMGVEIKEE